MEAPTGPAAEALCALCIQDLYNSDPNYRIIRPAPEDPRMAWYPSKIIAVVLAGTHTVELGGNGEQLTFRAVTVFQGTDLCASHVTRMAMMGQRSYYPREYSNR